MRTALTLIWASWLVATSAQALPGWQSVPRPATAQGRIHRGVLLVAKRDLPDPNFSRSVVLITHFDDTGTAGLILNRPLPVPATEALPPLAGVRPDPGGLFLGGPVAAGTLQLLARTETDLDPESEILENVHLIGGMDTFQELVDGRLPASALRLYAGYAGWGPGQLESELLRGDWFLRTADAETIFAPDPERLWPDLIERASEQWVQAMRPDDADVPVRAQYTYVFATRRDDGRSARGSLSRFPCLLSGVRVANEGGSGACGRGRQPTC